MRKPYLVLRSFYEEDTLDYIFSCIEKHCSSKGMFSLNRGKVFPALFRRFEESEKLLRLDELVKKISKEVGYKVRATKHSEFQINTIGGWHLDLGEHLGGYLPKNIDPKKISETKIVRVGIFSKETVENNKCTQFSINNKVDIPNLKYGDVLIFPPEQKHRATPGNIFARVFFSLSLRIKFPFLSNLFLKIESIFRLFENRKAIFFTTGFSEGEITDYYEKKNLLREDNQINQILNSSIEDA